MAVRLPEVADRLCIETSCLLERVGLSTRLYRRRRLGMVAWGEDEVEAVLTHLRRIGAELSALTREDLVEPGTILRPADRQLLRIPKARTPRET